MAKNNASKQNSTEDRTKLYFRNQQTKYKTIEIINTGFLENVSNYIRKYFTDSETACDNIKNNVEPEIIDNAGLILYQKINQLALIQNLTSSLGQNNDDKAIKYIKAVDTCILENYFAIKGVRKAPVWEVYDKDTPITWLPKEVFFHIVSFLGDKRLWEVYPADSQFKLALLTGNDESIRFQADELVTLRYTPFGMLEEIYGLIKKGEVFLAKKAINTLELSNGDLEILLGCTLEYYAKLITQNSIDNFSLIDKLELSNEKLQYFLDHVLSHQTEPITQDLVDKLELSNEKLQYLLEYILRYQAEYDIIEYLINKGANLNSLLEKALANQDVKLLENLMVYEPDFLAIVENYSEELFAVGATIDQYPQ